VTIAPVLPLRPEEAASADAALRLRQALRPEFCGSDFSPSRADAGLWKTCAVSTCSRKRISLTLCEVHWKRLIEEQGRPRTAVSPDEIGAFVQRAALDDGASKNGNPPVYSFFGLPPVLADEARLLVQYLVDTRGEKGCTDHQAFARTMRALRALRISSIFELSRTTARDLAGRAVTELDTSWYRSMSSQPRPELNLVRKMMRVAAPHHAPVPVEERLVWYQSDFGLSPTGGRTHGMVFSTYRLPWMVAWAKRWALYEIRGGRQAFTSLLINTARLRYLDEFLASQPDCPSDIGGLTRDHLERFLRWLGAPDRGFAKTTVVCAVARVRSLLKLHSRLDWEPALLPDAVIRRNEGPSMPPPQPQPIDAYVLDQLMSPRNLEVMEPWLAEALVIGRHQGLRASSVVTLPLSCLQFNGPDETQPVLVYRNVKSARNAEQPIDRQAVVDAIRRQQRRVHISHGAECPWLFPAHANNPHGRRTKRACALTQALAVALQGQCTVLDRQGNRVTHVAWGQFRDTRATELLNSGLSPTLVAAWLDHTALNSLQHYCEISTETKRLALDCTPLLDLQGRDVTTSTGAAGRDVEALRRLMHEATNAVPGGVCTLPTQEACPHLNRCFSCNHFATTPGHLPELFGHLQKSQLLAMAHENNGSARLAETQRREVASLRGVVTVLGRWVLDHPGKETGIRLWEQTHREALRALVSETSTTTSAARPT
jgi:site-specific recombinase XerD